MKIKTSTIALVTALGFTLGAGLPVTSYGASRDDAIIDPPIAGPVAAEPGIWRSKTQSLFDPVAHTLIRREYTIWDPMPSRDLDFVWIPTSAHDDVAGKINGAGRLIWRLKGKPAYDKASIFAEYRGTMKDGRAEGEGRYVDSTGISYAGAWHNGLMEGFGTLILPGGDEYAGQMRAGKANGRGCYIDLTGEVFEGNFVDGERAGSGTTTLPNGNSYRSSWLRGEETADSRLLRLAQSGGQLTPGGADDIRIAITVDKSKARDGDLVYAASGAGAQLTIQPDNKRLMEMWKGNAEIQLNDTEEGIVPWYGILSVGKAQLLPLTLSFGVQNRSGKPISVTGAYMAIDSSVSDLEPAIQLYRQLEACNGNPYKPSFQAENFGWGSAQNASMHFVFANPNASGRPPATVTKNVGTIARAAKIDLEPELKAAGVNTGTLAAKSDPGFVCSKGMSAPACLQSIKSTGVFGSIAQQVVLNETSIFVAVTGTLDYTWSDVHGAQQTRSSPYKVMLPLGHIKIEAECGEGGEDEVIAAKPLSFKLDQSNYRIPISFQRSVPAGQTSQFTVSVNAPKSSEHSFTVVLQLADGREISSRPVNLTYYLPSWFPEP